MPYVEKLSGSARSVKKSELSAWRIGLSDQFEERILPLDQESAEIWSELYAAGQKKGVLVPVANGLIAATALPHGRHTATRNTTHFEASGAMVIDPWGSPVSSMK